MIAAVLDGDEAARVSGNTGLGGRQSGGAPGACRALVRIRHDGGDFSHLRERRSLGFDRAACCDDPRLRTVSGGAPDPLARRADGLGRDRAGVDDDKIAFASRYGSAAHRLGFNEVQPAAEGQYLNRGMRAHAATSAKAAGSSRVSNSNSTGPVIST